MSMLWYVHGLHGWTSLLFWLPADVHAKQVYLDYVLFIQA